MDCLMPILSLSLEIIVLSKSLRQRKKALLWSGLPKEQREILSLSDYLWKVLQTHTRQSWKDINGTGKYHSTERSGSCRANCKQAAGGRLSLAPMKVLYLVQPGTDISCHCTQCYSNIHLRQPFWGHLTAQDHVLHHILSVFKKAKKIWHKELLDEPWKKGLVKRLRLCLQCY